MIAVSRVAELRRDFPILQREINGHPLVYLDSAVTSQKPLPVIEAMDTFYRSYNANIHRGVYTMSEEATARYEEARGKVARFINARGSKEVIFVRNATEAINLVAYAWGRTNLRAGDRIVATIMEHHSNLVPWQQLAAEKGADLRFVDIDEQGLLRMDQYEDFIRGARLVAFTHVSNALGTVNPVEYMTARAHAEGATVLVDGAQAVPHRAVDVQALGVDFYAASGHKMCGPLGSGFLWGRRELLEAMPPFLYGGDMIKSVRLEKTLFNDLPWKFEAGTPAVAEGIGLGAAVDYLTAVGMDWVEQHERTLTEYGLEKLQDVDGIVLYGPPAELRGGVISFNLPDIHPHDIASIADRYGIAIRAGHHCAMPLMHRLDVAATTRASFYLYNQPEEVDKLVEALKAAQKVFH
jgi:cysteine desulfurase/selenocysteine lyase